MKRAYLIAVVLAFAASLSGTVFAQGRHDEKPHGSTKPSATSSDGKYEPMPGGRHDEKPHGPRKPKKADTKQADQKKKGATDESGK
jgi:hypothetical protein